MLSRPLVSLSARQRELAADRATAEMTYRND
jgi:Zn-dependent protease with chaperone function